MSHGRKRLLDTSSDFRYTVKNGKQLADSPWQSCRVILTADRLIHSTNGGKQAIPYSNIELIDTDSTEYDQLVPDGAAGATPTPFKIGDNVILVDAQHADDFSTEYCQIALHDEVILAKYPAVVGGVVQSDAEWSKARFRLEDEEIKLGLPGDRTVAFPLEDVGTVECSSRQVMGNEDRWFRSNTPTRTIGASRRTTPDVNTTSRC